MKNLALLAIVLITSQYIFCQDTIYTGNKKFSNVKVYEVNRVFVKFLIPGNKNFRRVTLSAIDSIKDENGNLNESVKKYWEKRNSEIEDRKQRHNIAKEKVREVNQKRKIKNGFIDPYSNRISTGAQATSTSFFVFKILSPNADISAALGTHISYEKNILKGRIGIGASAFWNWNKNWQGGLINPKYYFLNRPNFRIGAGPVFSYSQTYFKTIKRRGRSEYYYQGLEGVNKDTTINNVYASSIGVNYGVQINLGKRYFISNDFFIAATDYKNIRTDKAFFSYRLGLGIRF